MEVEPKLQQDEQILEALGLGVKNNRLVISGTFIANMVDEGRKKWCHLLFF